MRASLDGRDCRIQVPRGFGLDSASLVEIDGPAEVPVPLRDMQSTRRTPPVCYPLARTWRQA
jgi:hypothetical protein